MQIKSLLKPGVTIGKLMLFTNYYLYDTYPSIFTFITFLRNINLERSSTM